MQTTKKNKGQTALLIAILFVASTLRAPITAVGPITGVIREALGVSNAIMGLLTTLPLLMFALISPLAGSIGVRMGVGRAMLVSLFCTLAGLLVRSYTNSFGLFFGMALVGVGMTFGNVLLPSVIKSEMPARAGLGTSLFSVTMASFAALSAGLSVPLCIGAGLGWRHALAVWCVLVVAAIAAWYPHRGLVLRQAEPGAAASGSAWKCREAWRVAGYMAAQAFIFYFFVAWLPTVAQTRGASQSVAGVTATVYQLCSIAGMLVAPNLAARKGLLRPVLYVISALYTVGLLLFVLLSGNGALWVGTILCGLCTGASFSVVLLLLALRANDSRRAAALSGMVQSVGYAAAAVSPTLTGFLFDSFGTWRAAFGVLLLLSLYMLASCRRVGSDEPI